ncbi:hypothetical protein EPO17_01955 [Patescibacteria group bacterium]|nr:MAG: hypothetical protein EPO17_01955 [Patescibacteria group bacterium]
MRESMKKKPTFKLFETERPFNDWRDSVVVWWNNFVRDGYSAKMPQLYLYGPSNVGKTTFINELLSEHHFINIFTFESNLKLIFSIMKQTPILMRIRFIDCPIRIQILSASCLATSSQASTQYVYGMNFDYQLA